MKIDEDRITIDSLMVRHAVSFLRCEPSTILQYARILLLGGLVGLLISSMLDGFGIITAVAAIGLGSTASVFSRWKTERGLWMLVTLFVLMIFVIYGLMIFGQLRDIMRGVRPEKLEIFFDLAVGTALLAITLRFLLRVAKENLFVSNPSHDN